MVAEWRIREKNEESLLGILYNRVGIVDRINVKKYTIFKSYFSPPARCMICEKILIKEVGKIYSIMIDKTG